MNSIFISTKTVDNVIKANTKDKEEKDPTRNIIHRIQTDIID